MRYLGVGVVAAFVLGLWAGLRRSVSVTRMGDGNGHVNIIVTFGFVNVTPINLTGQITRRPEEEPQPD